MPVTGGSGSSTGVRRSARAVEGSLRLCRGRPVRPRWWQGSSRPRSTTARPGSGFPDATRSCLGSPSASKDTPRRDVHPTVWILTWEAGGRGLYRGSWRPARRRWPPRGPTPQQVRDGRCRSTRRPPGRILPAWASRANGQTARHRRSRRHGDRPEPEQTRSDSQPWDPRDGLPQATRCWRSRNRDESVRLLDASNGLDITVSVEVKHSDRSRRLDSGIRFRTNRTTRNSPRAADGFARVRSAATSASGT